MTTTPPSRVLHAALCLLVDEWQTFVLYDALCVMRQFATAAARATSTINANGGV